MQPISIQTKWAKDVSPYNTLPEYPRPQMVRDNNWQNLNGLWNYTITTKNASKPSNFQGQILVPYPIESALSGVKKSLLPIEALWYQRTFEANVKKGQKILLHFGAVDWQATVYVNGKEIGEHSGGYTEFSFDITQAVKPGKNELVVKVLDPTDQGIGPHGKQVLNPSNIYYTASSGIWQTVWLETVPFEYIKKLILTPDIDKSVLQVIVEAPADYDVELVVSSTGKIVSTVKGKTETSIHLPIKAAKLWSPNSPFLYDLQVKLSKGTKILDHVTSYFGMRKISLAKDDNGIDRIFLNNQYYYNLGTLDQGFWPDGLYTAPTDSALQFDIMAIKAMGFNTIRKHIKVEPARWYYYTDKIGMLVWQDMVNPNQGLPSGSKAEFEKESFEILSQLHNYPSITTWVLFNEKWGQYDQERLTKWIKQTDPSRLINGHSGEYLYVNHQLRSPSPYAYIGSDITDVHSYPNPMLSIKLPGKAQVCGEFGGIGVPIEGHIWDDLIAGWGYNGVVTLKKMEEQYSQMIDSLKDLKQKGLSGSIYTQPFDVESEQNGLITYDRKISKLPIATLKRLNNELLETHQIKSNIKTLLSLESPADSTTKDYTTRLKEYEQGRRDSAFLRSLSILSEVNNNNKTTRLASEEYIKSVKNPLTEANLKFIFRFTKSSDSKGFLILKENMQFIDSLFGKNRVENLIQNIVYVEEIKPFEKTHSPNWDSIENRVKTKFGHLGQERVWGHRLVYNATHNNWNEFAKYFKLYFESAIPEKRNFVHINNLSWLVVKHIEDTSVISIAIKAMEYLLSKTQFSDAGYIDTYANLLFKNGRKSDALSWQKRAISLEPSNKEIIDNYEIMKESVKN